MATMSFPSRREYLAALYPRYREAGKREQGRMLDECCLTTGYNRKYATRLLNGPKPARERKSPSAPRGRTYTSEDVCYLKKLWEILDYPCGERLKPQVPELVRVLERCGELSVPPAVKEQLSRMSARTMDRRLALFTGEVVRRIHGTTKPGSLLKKQIPIVLSRWDETRAGYTELDLVAHCGPSAQGAFACTLNITDLATGWTEEAAILGKAEARVKDAFHAIERDLPFPLLGIDPDNGSEFINWPLFRYCLSKKIAFTRGRPSHKNDNAHIEEKNWTHVRKIVGYERLETDAEVRVLNELYRGPLRLYMNFFQPAMKLIEKTRVGGKLRRTYDTPRTPCQRALECPEIVPETKERLTALYGTLNPVKLKRDIEKKLDELFKLVRERKQQKVPVTFSLSQRIAPKLHF